MRTWLPRLAWLALLIAAVLVTVRAGAAPGRPSGKLAVSLPGGSAPLQLTPGQGGWVGTLTLANVGDAPLVVSRLSIRGDEDDVRAPPRVSVRFVDGAAASATLAPGSSRDATVAWMPERDPRVRQAFGHVMITSTDESAGEVAVGFHAQMPTGLGWLGEHALSWLIGLPLLVVALVGVSRASGRPDAPGVAHAATAIAALELVLSGWAFARFAPAVVRADGNDGFQLVERAVWVRSVGAEWYLGVDGLSAALVPLAALLWLVALVVTPFDRRSDAGHAALALLVSGVTAALVALDLTVLFVAWQVVLLALLLLLGTAGRTRGEHAAAKLGVYGALGSAALLSAFVALARASGPSFLVDGSAVAHALSIPDLGRTSFAGQQPLLGLPFVEVVWGLLLVAAAVAAPLVPLHGWLPEAVDEASPGGALLLVGVVTALGPYLLARVGLGALPEGARVAGGWMSALGLLAAAYGSFCALAQRGLRRFIAYASVAGTGATMMGLGSLSAEGLAGALSGTFSRGLAAAMVLGALGVLERRGKVGAFTSPRGLDASPAFAALVVAGLATSLGAPCFVGFWGQALAMLGTFGKHPGMALLLAVTLFTLAAAHLRAARLLLLGEPEPPSSGPRSQRRPQVEGASAPVELSARELAALVPLVFLALVLGVWPTPVLAAVTATVRDVAAVVDPPTTDPTGVAPPVARP